MSGIACGEQQLHHLHISSDTCPGQIEIYSDRTASFCLFFQSEHAEAMTFVRFFKSILTLSLQVALLAPVVLGQDAPLFIQGALEDATVSGDAYNAGGSITVNGFSMNVPENLLVQFPAAWVPWRTFVESKDKFLGFETLVFYSR